MKNQAITTEKLKKFAIENSFNHKMSNSRGLDSFDNYIGEGSDWVVVAVGRNRDSEILDESNFEAALDMLGGESETVQVNRYGHWGCGWFELILVDPKNKAALKTAYQIKQLMAEYPVLDESDYFEREYEYQENYAEETKSELSRAICNHLGFDDLAETEEMIDLAAQLQIECQRYYGNDSAIYIYENREPELRDWERLETCLKQVRNSVLERENPAYQLLCACFGMNDDEVIT